MVQENLSGILNAELVLKPLQKMALEEIRQAFRKSKRIIFQAATAMGKTIIATEIVKMAVSKGKRVLFISDRIILCNQTSDVFLKYGINHGVIQGHHERFDISQPVQVCSIQTLKTRGCPDADLIIIDECFDGDTKILTIDGERKISLVNIGDKVYNACGVGEVVNVYASKNKLLKVRLSNGKTIKCTEEHPFFTNNGWKPAGKLDVGERVFSKKDVCAMWEDFSSQNNYLGRWEGASNRIGEEVEQCFDLLKILFEEAEESDERFRTGERKPSSRNEITQAHSSRWKWNCKYLSRKVVQSIRHWVCNRIYSADKNGHTMGWRGTSTSLQNRHSKPGGNDRHRSRWQFASGVVSEGRGHKETGVLENIRVESVEIEQGAIKHDVYNLQVSGHPSYYAEGVLVHNCHVLYSAHKQIMADHPKTYFLGLTATPYSKGLGKYFDFHIEPITMKQLIANNYLVPFEIYGPSVADLTQLKVRAGEYTEESVGEVFDKADIIGDVVTTWRKITPGKKTIVFGANIAHLKHLVEQFAHAGVTACQINAYQDDDERKAAIDGFVNGKTTVLCSVEVATKGFDVPAVEVCVLAIATKSMIKFTQTTGRALRVFPGKEKAYILDFGGNAERLGFPDDFEFLGLDDGKEKINKKAAPKEKLPKACPSCDFIKPVGVHVCPACGFAPELKKDVDVAPGELERLQRKAKKDYTLQEKQLFLAQLNQYAKEHKMKRHMKGFYGWAIYAFQDKFGCRPSGKIDWSVTAPTGAEVRRFITHRNIAYANRKTQ